MPGHTNARIGAGRTPIAGRSFLALAPLLTLALPMPAWAQQWTERDVLDMAREAPGVVLAERRVDAATHRAGGVGLAPDPELSWEREQLLDGDNPSKDSFALTIPIDLSGRARAQSALADSTSAAVRAGAADERNRVHAAALHAFYETIAYERRTAITRAAIEALSEAERVLSRREAEGTAAGVDRMRLSLEVELARSAFATDEAATQSSRGRLRRILGRPDSSAVPVLSGELMPAATEPVEALRERAGNQEAIRELREARTRASVADDAAGSAWFPTLALTAGVDLEQETNARWGYVAGISLELPFFSRGRSVSAEAGARALLAEALLEERAQRTHAEVGSFYRRLSRARAEAERFESATAEALEVLLRGTESAYREGRRSLLELLDARRAATSVASRRVELELQARHAEIELRRAMGAW